MQFRIELGDVNKKIKKEFSEYIFEEMKEDLRYQVNRYRKKYEVRENLVLNSTLIKWRGQVPSHIDLTDYVENCLILEYTYGTYIVKVNNYWLVKGSLTPVSLLIKALEYGTREIPAFPLVRRLFKFYSLNYLNLFPKFIKERAGDIL